MSLTQARCVTVLGKGGVGRTTVAIGTALALARQGKQVLLLELSGAQDVSRALGLPAASYAPSPLCPGVAHACYQASDCLADFGRTKLGLPSLLTHLLDARPVRAFLDAIPGLTELLQLGKMVHELGIEEDREAIYDVCVVDAPATGHGLTLLDAARTMRTLTRAGPFTELARPIEAFLLGKTSHTLAVTTPEPLPMEETSRLLRALSEMNQSPTAVILNRIPQPLPSAASQWNVLREHQPFAECDGWAQIGEDLSQVALRYQQACQRFATDTHPVVTIPQSQNPLRSLDDHQPLTEPLSALFEAVRD